MPMIVYLFNMKQLCYLPSCFKESFITVVTQKHAEDTDKTVQIVLIVKMEMRFQEPLENK